MACKKFAQQFSYSQALMMKVSRFLFFFYNAKVYNNSDIYFFGGGDLVIFNLYRKYINKHILYYVKNSIHYRLLPTI